MLLPVISVHTGLVTDEWATGCMVVKDGRHPSMLDSLGGLTRAKCRLYCFCCQHNTAMHQLYKTLLDMLLHFLLDNILPYSQQGGYPPAGPTPYPPPAGYPPAAGAPAAAPAAAAAGGIGGKLASMASGLTGKPAAPGAPQQQAAAPAGRGGMLGTVLGAAGGAMGGSLIGGAISNAMFG
jgi:hypothetical protein